MGKGIEGYVMCSLQVNFLGICLHNINHLLNFSLLHVSQPLLFIIQVLLSGAGNMVCKPWRVNCTRIK